VGAEIIVHSEPLIREAYVSFGDVLSADRTDVTAHPANLGTAERRNFLVELANDRAEARANFASFRCQPRVDWPMRLTMLEKHPRSTQVFIPMNATRFLVVVALGDVTPNLASVRAFVAHGGQAVSYRPGTWHHPMIALDAVTDFACLVWEDGTANDCVEIDLTASGIQIEGPHQTNSWRDVVS
jgi:ureidoglycolate lyase